MKIIRINIISILLVFPQLLCSCLDEKGDNRPVFPSRTILFYMTGDSGLEEEIAEKTAALAAAWNVEGDNHLLVYQGRTADSHPRLLEIGKDKTDVLEEYKEGFVSFSSAFAQTLNDMVRHCPGSDYGLIVFSHGSGWLPSGTNITPRSVATDGKSEFELIDFAHSIPDGQFRFILFESCQMAGIEVAYELKDKTNIILASSAEIVSPGFTPIYARMLERLYKDTPDVEGFADDYYEYCNRQSGDARSATVSVISTAGLAPFKTFIKRVEEENVEHWEWVERDNIQHFDRRKDNYLFYDLEGYIRSIGSQKDINELAGLLDGVIRYSAATESFLPDTTYGYDIAQHCGLTIYIPVQRYSYLNTQRKRLLLFSEYQE